MKNSNSMRLFLRIFLPLWSHFCNDSLFRNSVYLMLSTAVMAGFGFVFWIITTHLYTSEQIGFATALISATILLSNLSMLGFNTALIKHLPKTKTPNKIINTAMTIVAVATIIASAGYVIGINYFAPTFRSLSENPSFGFFFVLFMILVSLNTLTDSVFIAYRASKYNLIVYTFFGLTKISLPFLLVPFGTLGVFFAYTGAVIVSFGLSIYFMSVKFNYSPFFSKDTPAIRSMAKFSFSNYTASFLSGAPTLIAPTFIINKLGESNSAYFYMASTIAALLYVIPQAITQSLFAESSHREKEHLLFVKKSLKLIGLLLLPGIVLLLLFSKFILLIFGTEYSQHSQKLLQIMAFTGIFLSLNLLGSTALKVQDRMKTLLLINMGYLVATLGLMYLWVSHGVAGVCWALFCGQLFMSLEFGVLFIRKTPKNKLTAFKLS